MKNLQSYDEFLNEGTRQEEGQKQARKFAQVLAPKLDKIIRKLDKDLKFGFPAVKSKSVYNTRMMEHDNSITIESKSTTGEDKDLVKAVYAEAEKFAKKNNMKVMFMIESKNYGPKTKIEQIDSFPEYIKFNTFIWIR